MATFPALGGDALVDVSRIVAIVPPEEMREGWRSQLLLEGWKEPYTLECTCSVEEAARIRAEALHAWEESQHRAIVAQGHTPLRPLKPRKGAS